MNDPVSLYRKRVHKTHVQQQLTKFKKKNAFLVDPITGTVMQAV